MGSATISKRIVADPIIQR